MYKQLIKRKIAALMQQYPSVINSLDIPKAYQRFDENKEKEIIVWIRQQQGKDKDQIKDIVKDKFNTSDQDAERLYYEAYPDGMSQQEEEIADDFEQLLPKEDANGFLDDVIVLLVEDSPDPIMEYTALSKTYDVEEPVLNTFVDYMSKLMEDRQITIS